MRVWLSLLLLASLSACTTTIEQPRGLSAPTSVAIVDHGRHASLILEGHGNEIYRYTYGDWEYYAKANDGILVGIKALLWPTQAGLGRKRHPGPITSENIRKQLRVGAEEILIFDVERDRSDSLKKRLDQIFDKNSRTLIYNPIYDLDFVHHPKGYWLFRNSNQMMASWIRELGTDIEGPAMLSRWELQMLEE